MAVNIEKTPFQFRERMKNVKAINGSFIFFIFGSFNEIKNRFCIKITEGKLLTALRFEEFKGNLFVGKFSVEFSSFLGSKTIESSILHHFIWLKLFSCSIITVSIHENQNYTRHV